MAEPRPQFESNIPEHLLSKASDSEKYIMQSISKLIQASDWNTDRLMNVEDSIASLDKRLGAVEGSVASLDKQLSGVETQVGTITPKLNDIDGVLGAYRVGAKIVKTKTGRAGALMTVAAFCFTCCYLYHNFAAIPALVGKVASLLAMMF